MAEHNQDKKDKPVEKGTGKGGLKESKLKEEELVTNTFPTLTPIFP